MSGQDLLVFNKAVYKDLEGVIYTEGVGIGTTIATTSLHISATDGIIVPKGTLLERPTAVEGLLRYNVDASQFEGYTANGWGAIGGGATTSPDQLTFISASNDSNLRFYTANELRMIINPYGNLGLGTSNPGYKLDVRGNAYIDLLTASNITVLSDFSYGGDTTDVRLNYQVTPTRYGEIVAEVGGKSNFDIVIPGMYRVFPENVDFYVNGNRIGYLNSNVNDFTLGYTGTNDNTDTLVNIVTNTAVSQSNSVSIVIYPSYLEDYGTLSPGYVVQNIDLTYWAKYDSTCNIYYNLGNVGIGTTYAIEQVHVEGDMWVRYMYASNFTVLSDFNYAYGGDSATARMDYQVNPTRYSEILTVGKSNFSITVPGLYAVYGEDVEIYVNGTKLGYINSNVGDYTVAYNIVSNVNTQADITLRSLVPTSNNIDIAVFPRYLDGLGSLKPGYVEQIYNITYWEKLNTSSNIYYTQGNVGIGTTNPRAALEVNGSILPSSCNVYDLGTSSLSFKDLYLGGTSIRSTGSGLTLGENINIKANVPIYSLPFTEQTRLQASDAAAYDNFGYSVALSSDGNTLAIGAYFDDNTGGTNAGSVYIFTRSGSTWTQQTRVQASDAAASDYFGVSVALSSDGNTLAIGAYADDNTGGTDAGSVYIFTRSGSTWTQQTRVQASDAATSDYFGASVALSSDGNTLAIGAYADDNTGGTDAGSVYIFTRSGSTWTQQTRVQASDAATSDNFGYSVALSSDGNTLAIGANRDDNTGGTDAGSVYIFTRSGSTWTQQTRVQASDAATSDNFGYSVALSSDGNTLAIGAYFDDNTGGTNAGSVYIFTRSGSTWTQQTRVQASDAAASDQFGQSVALSSDGNTLAIGAYADDNTGGTDAGSVYVFTRSGSTWTQQTRVQASDAAASDQFGWSVALSSDGNTLAIGAYADDNTGGTDAGSVYIFSKSVTYLTTSVGIGTTSPRAALEVNGSIISSSNVYDLGSTNLYWRDLYLSGRLTLNTSGALFPTPTGSAPLYAARAWVSFDGSTTPPTIIASANIASVSRPVTGVFIVNYTSTLDTANYALAGSARLASGGAFVGIRGSSDSNSSYSTTTVTLVIYNTGGSGVNPNICNLVVYY